MKFNETWKAMLNGKKVTRANDIGHGYIMINDAGDVVDNDDDLYTMCKKDFIEDWKIVDIPTAGTRLVRCNKLYRLIKETDGNYAVIDEETCVEQIKGITKKNLMRDLIHYAFGIAYKC